MFVQTVILKRNILSNRKATYVICWRSAWCYIDAK